MTIWMVIEDEPDLYEVLLTMYEMMGVGGKSFTTRDDALSWIEAVDNGEFSGELPELAMIDIRLPDDDYGGLHVARRLRDSPRMGNIAILLMTAYRLSANNQKKAIRYTGADRLLLKPLPEVIELQEILYDVVANKQ